MIKLRETAEGTVVHFTNWPGFKSKPATVTHSNPEGNIVFADGSVLTAFDDECYPHPVEGLEHKCSAECLTSL